MRLFIVQLIVNATIITNALLRNIRIGSTVKNGVKAFLK